MATRGKPAFGLAQLERELGRKGAEPVYLIEGEDVLLAREALDAIVGQALPTTARDFNLSSYSGDEEGSREFMAQARSFPFLAERRVVVVRRFEKMSFKDKRDEAALQEYLQDPSPSTVLIFMATKLDRRLAVSKVVDRLVRRVEVKGLEPAALPGWVGRQLQSRGLHASETACRRLVELVDGGLLELRNEVDKLASRYVTVEKIGAAEIEDTVGRDRAEEIWAIQHAFRPGDPSPFLQVVCPLLARDEPIRLSGLLARHVNNLLRMRVLLDAGRTDAYGLAKRLRRPAWLIERELGQARAFGRPELVLWLRNLQRADVQMKSYRQPRRLTLERAILSSFLGRELV